VPEASVAVGLSISTVRRLINSGRLPARFERGDKGQRRYFIAHADLAILAALGQGAGLDLSRRRDPHGLHGHHGGQANGAHGVHGAQAGQAEGDHGHHEHPLNGDHGDHAAHPHEPHGAPGPHEDPPVGDHGDHGDQGGQPNGDHGDQEGEPPPPSGGYPDHGTLGEYAAQWELAVLRERLAGAQEAVRLHAERVRGQSRDIGFLQAQLDRSREAEEQLRVLLARLTAVLPPPAAPPALAAMNVTPVSPKVRWWRFWRRAG
jgi:hypothetical protein